MNAARTTVFPHGLIVNPNATAGTVVMLHHAGATATSLLSLARRLPPEQRIVLIDRPGRGVRSREPRVHSFRDLVTDLETALEPFLHEPIILFGHSMGAMLAHEVAVFAERLGKAPRAVVLSGTHPTRSELLDLDLTSPTVAASQLELLGGTPAEVLADPALLELAAAVLAEDTAILRTYEKPTRVTEPRTTGYYLWLGAHDPTLPALDSSLWWEHARVAAKVTLFNGGHFYLFEDPRFVDALMNLTSVCFGGTTAMPTHSSSALKESQT